MRFSSRRFLWVMRLREPLLRPIAERTWTRINEHAILTRAAAISFYGIAAVVPFMALVIALTAVWLPWIERRLIGAPSLDPLDPLSDLLPADAASVLTRELTRLQAEPPKALLSFGVVALLWLSSSLFVEIIDAMNVIAGVQETRPFWKRRLIAMMMTLTQAAILITAVVSIVVWPQILKWLGLSQPALIVATALHGFTVFAVVLLSFALALYVGPSAQRGWEWITPGSLLGTLVLLGISVVFRFYAQAWANYSATYGSLAGIVVLMSWQWLSSVVLLVAAELNQVIEDASIHRAWRRPNHQYASRSLVE
jgi:membrane protein